MEKTRYQISDLSGATRTQNHRDQINRFYTCKDNKSFLCLLRDHPLVL